MSVWIMSALAAGTPQGPRAERDPQVNFASSLRNTTLFAHDKGWAAGVVLGVTDESQQVDHSELAQECSAAR